MFSESSIRYLCNLSRPRVKCKGKALFDCNSSSRSIKNYRNFTSLSQTLHVQIPRIQVDVAKSVSHVFSDEKFKPKNHPGILFRGQVCLPTEFVEGVQAILKKQTAQIPEEAIKRFNNRLLSRRLPIEKRDYRILVDKIETDVRAKDALMEPFLSKEEAESLETKRFEETKKRLRSLVYHWEPLNFNTANGLLYLLTRSAGEYAALYKIFYELTKKDPKFKPKTLLDFGSGLATVTWASNAFWNDSLKESVCVDASRDMNDLAELVFKRGNPQRAVMFPGVFFRQFLPESQETRFDLVTSAYSLLELPSAKHRIHTLNTLWRKTSNYIVIIERGTSAGFQILNEARDFILRLDRETEQPANCHVVSPCPHDMPCPQYNSSWEGTCHFDVQHKRLIPFDKVKYQREQFCYVVIKRGDRNMNEETWPRLIRRPLKRNRHVACRVCKQNGEISEIMLTQAKNSKPLYRAARKSRLGDCLPIEESSLNINSSPLSTSTNMDGNEEVSDVDTDSDDEEEELDLEKDFEVDDDPSGTKGQPS